MMAANVNKTTYIPMDMRLILRTSQSEGDADESDGGCEERSAAKGGEIAVDAEADHDADDKSGGDVVKDAGKAATLVLVEDATTSGLGFAKCLAGSSLRGFLCIEDGQDARTEADMCRARKRPTGRMRVVIHTSCGKIWG